MNKPVKLRFSRENMWTVAGFVLDSFETHQATFLDVLGENTFGADFLTAFTDARLKVKGLTGAGLRVGSGTLVTDRLYANLDAVKPLLDKLDVRLGLLAAKDLTVPVKDFKLKNLRDRINARDAEAVSRLLVGLVKLIGDNRAVLDGKGYKEQELTDLTKLQGLIDDDNLLQNTGGNDRQEATVVDDADYQALDALLGQVLRAGRLLFKTDKVRRKQYEQVALEKRVTAGERPKPRPGDGE